MIAFPLSIIEGRGLFLKPDELSNFSNQLENSNFNCIKDNCFGLTSSGDIFFNVPVQQDDLDSLPVQLNVVSHGMYVYSSRTPNQLLALTNNDSTIEYIGISFWGDLTLLSLEQLYQKYAVRKGSHPHRVFVDTLLMRNFCVLRNTLTAVNIIDINLRTITTLTEPQENALIAFIVMLNHLGYGISFTIDLDSSAMIPKVFGGFFEKLMTAIGTEIEAYIKKKPGDDTIVSGLSMRVVKAILVRCEEFPINDRQFIIFGSLNKILSHVMHQISIQFKLTDYNTNGFFIPDFKVDKNSLDSVKLQSAVKSWVRESPQHIGGIGIGSYDYMLQASQKPMLSLPPFGNAIQMGLNEMKLKITSKKHKGKFVPLAGLDLPFPISEIHYAFCSPIFTLVFEDKNINIPTLTLKVDDKTNKVELLLPPSLEGWTPEGLIINKGWEFRHANTTVYVQYESMRHLHITIK